MEAKNPLLSIAYLPPISWFQHLFLTEAPLIEAQENYVKQSYRNRCKILSANGVLDLSIPIEHQGNKIGITNIAIKYQEPWQKRHWQAICSAYGKSPFFLYYRDAFEPLYLERQPETLFEFNLEFINLFCKLMKIPSHYTLTQTFLAEPNHLLDIRNQLSAKGAPKASELIFEKKYHQVFEDKFPFQANLSVLDLLCNNGPLSADYLLKKPE